MELSDRQKMCLSLQEVRHWSIAQIATRLGISKASVHRYLRRGRRHRAEYAAPHNGGEQ